MHGRRRMMAGVVVALALTAAGCGGGGDGDATQASVGGDTVVIDPDAVAEAREDLEDTAPAGELTIDEVDPGSTGAETATATSSADDGIEVAEAEEDELDGLLNSLTVFTSCLEEQGFEFIGAPGFGEGQPEDFEQPYLEALGACAAESNILEATAGFSDAQANLTPEEIELNNIGLPVFADCMTALGWEVAELVPDERGALGFGPDGLGLTPPGGGLSDFRPDDVDACRAEAEQYVAENVDTEG